MTNSQGDSPPPAAARSRALDQALALIEQAHLVSCSPALPGAHQIQQRVAAIGFDWPDARGAWEKVREELREVESELGRVSRSELEEEIGDLLFSVVNLSRLAGVDPVRALALANHKFVRRFTMVEELAVERGVVLADAGLAMLDRLWDEAKRKEQ